MVMEDYPNDLLEFEERFCTEDACRAYVQRIRWPEGFRCPRCGGTRYWWMTKRRLFQCVQCGLQTSLLAGTIFQDSRKPLRLWFRAMWHISTQKYGANALGIQRVLDLGSYETAWVWLHKLRRAMVRPGRDRLSGVVEVDETFIGGEKHGKHGRGAAGKTLVVVAAQHDGRRIGRIRLFRVPDATAESLTRVVKEAVEPGSTVCTDGLRSYLELPAMGYQHNAIRKDESVGENPLPKVHLVASLLKRWLLGTYQGAAEPAHLDYYLDEYTFRFNRRTSRFRGKLFYRLVEQAVAIDPVPAKEIWGGTENTKHNM